eukprot:jgi/Mesvir1/28300/Mv04822-RA.1
MKTAHLVSEDEGESAAKLHILVTGGAGFIGSHACLQLLELGHRVTVVDNLSRGNVGAIRELEKIATPGQLRFVLVDLGDKSALMDVFANTDPPFDVVMHFAALAYVGESMAQPLLYWHNITANTLTLLEVMRSHGVGRLIYSSTCATYGEPESMPITETTPLAPINPYGKAKKASEDVIRDESWANPAFGAVILRYFNVIGNDPQGRVGEAPRAELRHHGRISGACFDAALGRLPGLTIMGTDYKTKDGTCVRDYIHVVDLVRAHVMAMPRARPGVVETYNVGVGKGYSVREFVDVCRKVTGKEISVKEKERRPGDYAEVYSDPSKIYREIGWRAQYTELEESIRHAWNWQVAHPHGYDS